MTLRSLRLIAGAIPMSGLAGALLALALLGGTASAQGVPPNPPRYSRPQPTHTPPQPPPPPAAMPIGAAASRLAPTPAPVVPMNPASPPPPRPAAAVAPAPALLTAPAAPPPRPAVTRSPSTGAHLVAPPETAWPIGATMRCQDGTYLTGTPAADRCANNGGVTAILAPRPAPPAPRPHRP